MALVLILQLPAGAQEYRARVQGVVTDPTSARIAGATVTLTNTGTGVKEKRTTDETGHYLFDLVPPGNYTVEIEATGFNKSVYSDVLVQSRGDVTVDSTLKVGDTKESVTVSERVGQVEFNSVKAQINLDSKLVSDIPNFGRSPWLLATIDPSVEFMEGASDMPFRKWGDNGLRIAGGQEFSNDLQVDGSPVTLGLKGSFTPNTSAVGEVSIQQNAVDAEIGNSSGGIVAITSKAGTNEFHGDAWYLGRYPWANALEDRHYRTINLARQHTYGFDVGTPIRKNKLFNYFSFEQWKVFSPSGITASLPTAAEITGDFSQSKLANGDPLVIYDPFSTKVDSSGNITRTAFNNAIIPAPQQDPIAVKFLTNLNWAPNRTPDDPTGRNNYAAAAPQKLKYFNVSDRVDWYVSDKIRLNGRFGRFVETAGTTNPTGSALYQNQLQSEGNESYQFAGNMTYTISPRTVIDIRGDWHSMVDEALPPTSVPGFDWQDLYAGQDTLLKAVEIPGMANPKRPPRIQVSRSMWDDLVAFGDAGGYWYSHPEGKSIHAKVLHSYKSHFLKGGVEYRYQYGKSLVMYNSGFNPTAASTADTYLNPNTGLSGNGYASFLTGALGDPGDYYQGWGTGSLIHQTVVSTPESRFWSFYANDDWKATSKITVSLGLRYEYELPWSDPQNRGSRGMDFTKTNATLAANLPQIDPATLALVKQYYTGPLNLTSGVWMFSTKSHPGMWNSLATMFEPRVGVAIRMNDKTALRIAYGRWAHPWVQQGRGITGSLLDVLYPGFSSDQYPGPMILGVPQAKLSNPYPATAPLIPTSGQSYGENYALGSGQEYYYQDRLKDTTDRFNVGLERQLPWGIVGKATTFINFSHNLGWTQNPNQVDPALYYQYGSALNQVVNNPFYMYGTPETFPGPLRYQQTVPLTQLLRPYPQYGDMQQDYTKGVSMRYQSIQFDFRRPFRNGLSLFFAYNYHRQQDQYFYDDLDRYQQKFGWTAGTYPRHRISEAASWELPIGKGKTYLSGISRPLDLLVGGWNVGTVLSWRSGDFTYFGGMLQVSDPAQNIPDGAYFNPAAFQLLPPYTRRTNQNVYPGINGPGYFDLDASLNKYFNITEKFRLRLDMTAYNALNNFTLSDPVTDVTNLTQFGYTNGTQLYNTFGRRMEFGLKVLF